MSQYNNVLFPSEEGGSDRVYGQNAYLKGGCQKPGHKGQPLLHIFINPNSSEQQMPIFGCAECVCESNGQRTLSLISAMNIPPKMSMYNFPELNSEIKKETKKLMSINNELIYDQVITARLEGLYENLMRIYDAKKEEALSFVLQINNLGERAKAIYQERTNCFFLREAFEAGEENIIKKLDQAVEKMYNNKQPSDSDLLNITNEYNSKFQSFQVTFVLEIQNRLIDTISKMVFSQNMAKQLAQVHKPEHGIMDIAEFQHFGDNSGGYKDVMQQMQMENIRPKNSKLALKVSPFQISTIENNVISLKINLSKEVIAQANSTATLNPYLTYKIVFEVTEAPLIPNSVNSFLIGIGPVSDKETLVYEKSPFQKIFLSQQEYKKGLSYVQYGDDIGKIERDDQRRFVFKFCIAKNLFKFMDEKKNSLNILNTFERADLTKQYCLYILNQITQFELRIVSAMAK